MSHAGSVTAEADLTAQADLTAEVRAVVSDVLDKGPEDLGAAWRASAEAGLLGLAAPAGLGGEGLGLTELGALVHEAATRARDLPFAETLVSGLWPLTRCGTSEQQERFVPGVVAGELLLAPALDEPGRPWTLPPASTLRDGRLTGSKLAVPLFEELGGVPTLLVVTATEGDGSVAVVVDPAGDGVTARRSASSRGVPEASYDFDEAPVLAVLGPGSGDLLRDCAVAGWLLRGSGLLAGARDLTAVHVKERRQFGRRLAEFQGVAMQAADVFVTTRLVGLATAEVVRRVEQSQPAYDDAAVAAHWFCARGPAAMQTCHHLHGGVGVDETYPLHRYFARLKDTARLLGGAEMTLAAVPPTEPTAGANLELDPSQRAFKEEVRAYFAGLVDKESRAEMRHDRHGPAYHRTIRQMGADGWMGVGWPVEYGGKGLGDIEQQIFANEASRADVHLPSVTLQTVGPTLQAFGTEHQKELFLQRILSGDVHFAIGYSEPDAGTDLASLRTTAKRATDDQGEHFVVNGQKLWTTGGHAADYVWLAVRTDPDAPKHRGISVLIVDTRDPGYSWTPIITSDGSHHVNATYYNDVRVPVEMLVGQENEGWRLITTQLNHERVMLGPAGRIQGLRDLVADWARGRTDASGTPLLEVPPVREVLARATAAARVNELLNWQVAGAGATGVEAVADASASKVFASEEVQSLGLALERVVTSYGDLADPATADLADYLDATSKRNLVLTFGGGVNEVQRELISMFGLGLPKVPR